MLRITSLCLVCFTLMTGCLKGDPPGSATESESEYTSESDYEYDADETAPGEGLGGIFLPLMLGPEGDLGEAVETDAEIDPETGAPLAAMTKAVQ